MRYLPLIAGLLILAVAATLVPWSKVLPYLGRLSPFELGLLTLGGGLYYLGRIVRYWVMLRMLGLYVAFGKVAIACLVAQPVAVLPGGELYRGAMLKRYGNVSLKDAAPTVLAQSIAESFGLLIVALLGITVLRQYLTIVLGIAAAFVAVWVFIRWHDAHTSHKWLNKLPWVNVSRSWVQSFLGKNRKLLTGWNFVILLLASFITTFAGIVILYIAGFAIGVELSFFAAAMAFAVPTVLELVSFLPGGLGVHEGLSVGILTLFGIDLPSAVALTIIVRLFTLGIGFPIGFAAMAWDRFRGFEHFD